MQIQTTRFGKVELKDNEIIEFPEGILGFTQLRRFALLDDPHDEIFLWLQSCEEPGIAFPVLEPELFSSNYSVKLTKHDLEALRSNTQTGLRFFSIVTIPADPTLMTANLKAPIAINSQQRVARQCVLQDNDLDIREPIFATLQQRLHQPAAQSLRTVESSEMAVRLTDIPQVVPGTQPNKSNTAGR